LSNKKKLGSYYTPTRLADFVADYCLSKLVNQQTISILEPSVGDGAFINAISKSQELERFETINNTVVEKENDELKSKIEELEKLLSLKTIDEEIKIITNIIVSYK
jgi:adenine-specific DNA-methyltransferase